LCNKDTIYTVKCAILMMTIFSFSYTIEKKERIVIFFNIEEINENIFYKLKYLKLGEVHSVYKNTINFIVEEKLLAIHPRNTIKTPMSIRIMENELEFKGLNISIKDKVIIYQDKFTINEHEFNFSSAKTWNSNINQIKVDMTHMGLNKMQLILNTMDLFGKENSLKEIVRYIIQGESTEFLIDKEDYLTERYFLIIVEWVQFILDKVIIKPSNSIARLIGLGNGLTPSGDDFLLGLLSIFTLTENNFILSLEINKSLKKLIKNNLQKTTFLSKEFLSYAIRNEYSEIFHEFYTSLKDGNRDEIRSTVIKFIGIGSSSGMDTLAGITLGMHIVNQLFKNLKPERSRQ